MKTPQLILEVANTHGGDKTVLLNQIHTFANLDYPATGIKFQPFKYDKIALEDFAWYKVYQELFFTKEDWNEVLQTAHKHFNTIWLDLFDSYGCEILDEHLSLIGGVKLQASVLENREVFNALQNLNLKQVDLVINISGYEISDIEAHIETFKAISARKIVLQIGYQSYPTSVEDTALNKIQILKAAFPDMEFCFADHMDAQDPFALIVPSIAASLGCQFVEKHICLDRNNTKYDHFSALELDQTQKLVDYLKSSASAFSDSFVSRSENQYLNKSIQIPILESDINGGQLVAGKNLIYRRTGSNGLTYKQIQEKQGRFEILKQSLKAGRTLGDSDFKKAKIATVVAGRMKSTRLKKKAILPIHGKASINWCLDRCQHLTPHSDLTILATSTTEEDAILKEYAEKSNVEFIQGSPDDVIKRYLVAADKYNVDVIIRVTADCPLPSPEITEILLESHFKSGADYTAARDVAVGSAGEIYNVEALRRVIDYLGEADYSEYMTWYLRNNPDIFKVNIVDLPSELVRDYRLTLDYQEDLDMFETLIDKLELEQLEPTLVNVFKVLDENPAIPKMNGHITLKYKTDQELIDKLNRVTRISL